MFGNVRGLENEQVYNLGDVVSIPNKIYKWNFKVKNNFKDTLFIKNIKIDKITVWDSGNGDGDGSSSTANFMKGMMGAVPPLEDLFKLAGMELPNYLKGNSKNEKIEDAQEIKQNKKK
ncbi:MAG: hypothetical protein L3J56_08970 [Bacteroidales bacterium]|nr:hypothetical protein [Bacteroidales bacterium]